MANIHQGFLSVSAAVLTVFLAACSPDNEEVVDVARPVRVVTVEENQAGQTVQFAGTVESQVQVDLAFRIGGRVLERLVNVGDAITAGQRIARLDLPTKRMVYAPSKRVSLPRTDSWPRRASTMTASATSTAGRSWPAPRSTGRSRR